MIRLSFEVTYADGRTVEAVTTPADQVAFERNYDRSVAALADEQRMEWLYFLAWAPLHRTGVEPRSFDDFLAVVDTVAPVEAVADPTSPAPSAG